MMAWGRDRGIIRDYRCSPDVHDDDGP
jgi:hypothetical protein